MGSAAPRRLAELVALVEQALPAAIAPALARVEGLHGSLRPWTDELRGFLDRGKRLRPALLLLGHQAVAPADDLAPVVPGALALELLHACALLHDDLVDDAASRRGRPAAHVAGTARHVQQGWAGDPQRYGAAVAVLLGDLAFTISEDLLLDCAVPPGRLLAALRVFTAMREEVMAGQALDVQAAASRLTDRELALRVADVKSGRYSVARPLQLGAVLAGADDATAEALADAVAPLGRAFQLRDDVLGVFGAPDATGKSTAGDLREGKRTLLVAETSARLDAPGRARLDALLGDPDLHEDDVEWLRTTMRAVGALDAVQAEADAQVATARQRIAMLDGLDEQARATLVGLGAWLAGRDT